VLDEAALLEARQRRSHAPFGNIDSRDDLPLAERLVGVFEEDPIHRALGGV
jgi:hypothetical protein